MKQNRENSRDDPSAEVGARSDVRPEAIEQLLDPRTVCIFPSEVSARFWMEQAAVLSAQNSAQNAPASRQASAAQKTKTAVSQKEHGEGHEIPSMSVSVIRADRFVSWDRFLESCSSAAADDVAHNREAVDAMIRETAAFRLAEELSAESASSETPALSYFIPPEYSASAHRYRGTLSSLMPHLDRLEQTLPELPHLSEQMKRDIRILGSRYRDFLDRHNLYEPQHLAAQISAQIAAQNSSAVLDQQKQYVLFFPEILLGQDDCIERLSSCENFRTCSGHAFYSRNEESREPYIRVFENSRQELHWLTDAVERLMQEGVQPQDIVITAADFNGWYELISEEMAIRGLPWVFRRGRALSAYPAARFFSDLQSAIRSRWSLRDVKRLLLNRGYPWKHREAFERITAVGIEDKCLRNYEQGKNREVDVWSRALELRGEQELLKLWRQFTGSAAGLAAESKPEMLQRRLLVFIDTWLDRGKSGADTVFHEDSPDRNASSVSSAAENRMQNHSGEPDLFNDVFDFCIEKWMKLAAVCRKLHIEKFPSLYGFWTQLLSSEWYVPQIHQEGTEIYPYGVSAGIHPKHHFIIGAGQQHTTIRNAVFPGAGDDFSRMFGIPVFDRSSDYLELYTNSGELTYISCSRTAADGPHLPPAWFVERNMVQNIGRGAIACEGLPAGSQHAQNDPCVQEHIWWGSGHDISLKHRDIMKTVYPVQKNGFMQAYRTIFRKRLADMSSEILPEDLVIHSIVQNRLKKSDEGLPEISPTQLDAFMKCPFQWLFQRLMHIEDIDMDPGYGDPRDDGTLFHSIAQQFFTDAVGIGHHFHAQKIDVYQQRMSEIIREELRRKRRVWVRLVPAAEQRMREWLEEGAEALLASEADLLAGWKCTAAEQTLRSVHRQSGYVLSGRIDRTAEAPGATGYAVIDYKRGTPKSGSAYQSSDSGIPSYQLPFYGMLIEHDRGEQAAAALYFSVIGRKYQIIYHDDCFSTRQKTIGRERFTELMNEAEEAVKDMILRIGQGDMTCTELVRQCSGCVYRDLCRKRYTVQ